VSAERWWVAVTEVLGEISVSYLLNEVFHASIEVCSVHVLKAWEGSTGIDPLTFHLAVDVNGLSDSRAACFTHGESALSTNGRMNEHQNRSGLFGEDKFLVTTERRTTVP
jgi:hypothetical protein